MNKGYIFLGYLSLAVLSFIDNGRGSAYPEILNFFQIGPSRGSLIFTSVSITSLITNMTTSYWLPRLGSVLATRIALVLMGVGSYGIGLGGDYQNFNISLAFGCIAGLGFGILLITMNLMVSNGAPASHKRQYLSGLHGVYGIASLLAPQLLSVLIIYNLNWIDFFKLIPLFAFLVLLYSFTVHDSHFEAIKENQGKMDNALIMKLFIGIFTGLYVSSEVMISSRLKYYLVNSHDFSEVMANNYLSYFFLFLMIGRLVFAFVPVHMESRKLISISLTLSFISFTLGKLAHPIFFPMTALFMSFCFPVIIDWISDTFKKKNHIVLGYAMTLVGVCVVLMHYIFGHIADIYGTTTAFNFFYVLNIGSMLFYSLSLFRVKKYFREL